MDLKWQDGAIPAKKLKKPSRTPEEVSQAKKQYEQKRSRSFKLHWTTDRPWLCYDELLLFVVSSTVEQPVTRFFFFFFSYCKMCRYIYISELRLMALSSLILGL
jgi:hypothetical protein